MTCKFYVSLLAFIAAAVPIFIEINLTTKNLMSDSAMNSVFGEDVPCGDCELYDERACKSNFGTKVTGGVRGPVLDTCTYLGCIGTLTDPPACDEIDDPDVPEEIYIDLPHWKYTQASNFLAEVTEGDGNQTEQASNDSVTCRKRIQCNTGTFDSTKNCEDADPNGFPLLDGTPGIHGRCKIPVGPASGCAECTNAGAHVTGQEEQKVHEECVDCPDP